jgi:hypothetical protein
VDNKAFDPKDVTTPIQLIAALLLALLSFGALFLKGAHDISDPTWAPNLLVLSAVGVIAIGSGLVFLMLTLFRPQTLSDDAYLKWKQATEAEFHDFQPERVQGEPAAKLTEASVHFKTEHPPLDLYRYLDFPRALANRVESIAA